MLAWRDRRKRLLMKLYGPGSSIASQVVASRLARYRERLAGLLEGKSSRGSRQAVARLHQACDMLASRLGEAVDDVPTEFQPRKSTAKEHCECTTGCTSQRCVCVRAGRLCSDRCHKKKLKVTATVQSCQRMAV